MIEQKDDGYIRFRCKACGKKLKIRTSYEGGNIVSCPRCLASITLPLANLEALVQKGPEITPKAERKLDPKMLLSSLRQETEAPAADSTAGAAERKKAWAPQAGRGTVEELENFREAVQRLDEEMSERLRKLLRQPNVSRQDVLLEARRIRRARAERIRRYAESRARELRPLLAELEAGQEKLSETARARRDQVRKALWTLEAYVQLLLAEE